MINLKQNLIESRSEESVDRGCLMAVIEEPYNKMIFEFGKKIIPDEDLYWEGKEFGREIMKKIHSTIRYGFISDLTEIEIRRLLKGQKEFEIEIIALDKFEAEDYDVVIFKVNSPDMERLHKLSGVYPNENKFPTYKIHITLCYVQKGKFPLKKNELSIKIPIKKVVYSPASKNGKSWFDLEPKEKLNEDIDLQISNLEKQWDLVDSTGNNEKRKEIENQIQKLRNKKEGNSLNYNSPKSQELWSKLKSSINEIASYVGDCKTIINSGNIFGNATEMSQTIENSESIDYKQFIKSVSINTIPRLLKLYLRTRPDSFSFGKHENLIWACDDEKDAHYFFI